MKIRRTGIPLHPPHPFAECMKVAGFMLRWFQREQILNLQAMGYRASPRRQLQRKPMATDLGLQPVPRTQRAARQ